MAHVTLSHLTKTFRKEAGAAVTELECNIADRELLALAGPSGSGKSTTLRMIAGLEQPTAGDIMIDNRRVNDLAPKERNVASVLQSASLYPHLTVSENLAFGLKLRNYSRTEIKKRIDGAADALGLAALLPRKPASLARLERRQVALARVLARQASVILLDDPLANLEPAARRQLRSDIVTLHRRSRATVILATPDQADAMKLGERVALLHHGRLQQLDAPRRLYQEPRNLVVARFFGDSPINLINGSLRLERAGLVFHERGDGTIRLVIPPAIPLAETQSTLLGVRPEDVELTSSENGGGAAIIDRVECRGADSLWYLETGAHTLVCRSRTSFNEGETGRRAHFRIDPARAHFFAPETSDRIS